jgi:PAS domain S-box-containing protein
MSSGRALRVLLVGGDVAAGDRVRELLPCATIDQVQDESVGEWCRRACDACLLVVCGGEHAALRAMLQTAIAAGFAPPILVVCEKLDPVIESLGISGGAADVLVYDEPTTPLLERCLHHAIRRARELEELGRSEARFRSLIEGSPDAIFMHARGIILYANPAGTALLGYESRVDLVARAVAEIVHGDSLKTSWAEMRELVERGLTASPRPCQFLRRDGKILQAEIVGLPVSLDDGSAVATVARDLTDRNQMQARLILADRMASVGTLAAGVAHEINNPLAYITANLGFAAEELARLPMSDALAEVKAAIAEAREGAERVRLIVRDLKTFSRVDEEVAVLADVRRVLESAINMSFNEIRHRAQLVREYHDAPPVVANEGRLGQVFLNLLVNAAQAIPDSTAAQQHTIKVVLREEHGEVVVEVSDTGVGIPPEHLPRLFDPFFTTKPVGIGTGLGLAVCHGIVTSLGGEISATSERGKGSTFKVRIPGARLDTRASTEPPDEPKSTRRARVLVLDDEPLVCASIRRMLSREHDIVTFTDPRAALAQIAQGAEFDVIFCDLMMPEMTGMDFHDALLSSHPCLAEAIVFFTGGAFTARAKAFLDKVPNARLEKPPVAQNLRALIRERIE